MGELFAAVIGVETYQDAALKPVLFAEADASAISAALADLGCRIENQTILLNAAATKGAVEAELKRTLLGLTADDQCFVFFAGHGRSNGNTNFLLAHDTRMHDWEDSSVRLQRIIGLIKQSDSRRTVLFLDACHTGIIVEDTLRSPALQRL